MPSITIVIVNYHCAALVVRCIDSLLRHCSAGIEIVVVDNSVPPEAQVLADIAPQAVILPAGNNIGFAAACNLGISHALQRHSDFALLLNPDTRTETDFITPLAQAMQHDTGLGMICPRILKDNKTRDLWFSPGKMLWARGVVVHAVSEPEGMAAEHTLATVRPADFITGCAVLIRAAAIREVGMLDERYFLYFEDTDYAMAFRRAGWRLGYMPAPFVLHAPSSTTIYLSESYLYYFARNQVLFIRRWSARTTDRSLFYLKALLGMLPASVLYFGVLQRDAGRMKAYMSGVVDGFRGKVGKKIER